MLLLLLLPRVTRNQLHRGARTQCITTRSRVWKVGVESLEWWLPSGTRVR